MTKDELPASVTAMVTGGAAKEPMCQSRSSAGYQCIQSLAGHRRYHSTVAAPIEESDGGVFWHDEAATPAAPPVRTYSEADEVADNIGYIAETSHNAGVTETFAALSGEFQKVATHEFVCKNCGEPLDFFPIEDPYLQWKHSDGYYGCSTKDFATLASPAAPSVVISSPAHFLPELKSDADHFAEEYMAEMNAAGKGIPAWLQPHLAWMFLMGAQMERLKGGK